MATHAHAQGERPGSSGDKIAQNMSGVEHRGRAYITELNHSERHFVQRAVAGVSPTPRDLKDGLAVLGAAMLGEVDDDTAAQYARWAAIIRLRQAGTLHMVRHAACATPVYHDGTSYPVVCKGCGGTIASPADIDGVSAGHPLAPPVSRDL